MSQGRAWCCSDFSNITLAVKDITENRVFRNLSKDEEDTFDGSITFLNDCGLCK